MSKTPEVLAALTTKYASRITEPLKIVECREIYEPHPFTIGAKYVAHASDHCGGMLGEATMRAIPCAHCHKPYSEHKQSLAIMVEVTRKCTNKEAGTVLHNIKAEAEADGISLFGFVKGFELISATKIHNIY